MSLNIRDSIRKYGAEYLAICGLSKYFPVMNAESSVFFVNTSGKGGNDSAANQGQTPDTPLLTITKALSYCTSDKNDYIFVIDYYQPTGEVWPISITKKLIHIIGISGVAAPYPWVQPTGSTPAFVFASGYDTNGCEIAGFELGAGSNDACIETWNSGNWNIHIHDCGFGTILGMTGAYGISINGRTSGYAGEFLNWLIENNRFGTKLTAAGIEIPSTYVGPNTCKGTIIRNNHFHVNTGDRGINVSFATADFADGGIFNNTFECDGDAADGEAVYFASGAKGSVHGNAAWTDDGVIPANNPFYDAGTTNMSWGANIRGGGVATGPFLATPTNI